MDFVFGLPAFLKIGLIFTSILVVYRLGLPLSLSIIIHSLLLTLFSGRGVRSLSGQLSVLLQPDSYLLILVIMLLLLFTKALQTTRRMEKTVTALKNWLQNHRIIISGLPALIGLLPMPGGALFSAPLVESIDSEQNLDPAHKVAINYWFRHIWEYWWPLYPGVILAIRYSSLPVGLFYLIQIPLTIASIIGGYLFLLKKITKKDIPAPNESILNIGDIVLTLGPILLLVFISVAGSYFLPRTGVPDSLSNLIALLISLAIALSLLSIGNVRSFGESLKLFTEKRTWMLFLLIIGIQLFSNALQIPPDNEGLNLVSQMRNEFISVGIPLIFIIIAIPFISGFVMGIAVGFVGASFPLVFALLGDSPPLHILMSVTTLAYASGYVGMILSPVHICFLVTNEYFKTKLFQSYHHLFGPIIIVIIAAILLSTGYYFSGRL